jgi:enterochelin esterase-like enzyme
MGGLISLYALMEYPEVFGGAACLSTHWPVEFYLDNNPFTEAIASYVNNNCQALRGKRLYLDRGTKTLDSIYEEGQNKIDSIINKASIEGLVWESKVYQDAKHTENDWNKRLDIPLRFLFEKN